MKFIQIALRAWVWGVVGLAMPLCAAWNPNPQQLAHQSTFTGSEQLHELSQAFKPEYSGYIAAGWVYFPLPTQSPLRTSWGEHDGYIFRQRLGAWLTNPLDSSRRRLGLAWWAERQGWDSEDFLLFPAYGRFGRVQGVHTFGVTLSDSVAAWGVAGGAQWLNVEYVGQGHIPAQDTLRWWGLAQWGPVALTGLYQGLDWREWRLSLDLQSRPLRGGVGHGFRSYWPDLDLLARSGIHDSLRVEWNQNVYAQKIYALSAWSLTGRGLLWSMVRFHPDASHLVSLDATFTRPARGGSFVGGGLSLPFIRVAYNHSHDHESLFGARGVWVVEFRLAIGSSHDSFFGLGAPQRAPTESITQKPSTSSNHPDSGDLHE